MNRKKTKSVSPKKISTASSLAKKQHTSGSVVISAGLLEIYGLGVLIMGDSGVGKSESALELVTRGHRFVSDDVVEVKKTSSGRLMGRAPQLARNFMELRGLGLINIREVFGPRAIRASMPIDLIVQLKKWQMGYEYNRLGLEFPEDYDILGIKIPQLIIPVAPGRNIATLIEVACRVHFLRQRGYHASTEIVQKMKRVMG